MGRWKGESLQVSKRERDLPVRLTCEDVDDFHPHHGFHEGYRIEVYNHTDEPVQIKGFGLVLGMTGQAPWEWIETPGGYPLSSFPRWLKPRESWEGYIDTEALGDTLHEDGVFDLVFSKHAFVDVSGYDRELLDPDSPKA
jgi:hypothetical protein